MEEQLYGTCFILPTLHANMDLSLVLNTNTAVFIVLLLLKTRIYAPPLSLIVFCIPIKKHIFHEEREKDGGKTCAGAVCTQLMSANMRIVSEQRK